MDAPYYSGSDNRDVLGYDPMECAECNQHPCICETHCLRHRKPLVVDPFWGITGGCLECERVNEADIPA